MNVNELTNRIDRSAFMLGLACSSFTWLFADLQAAASLFVGTVLGVANFMAIRYVISRVIGAGGADQQSGKAWLFGAKFLVFAIAIYLAINVVAVEPLAFTFGISCVVLALTFESLRWRPVSSEDIQPSETV